MAGETEDLSVRGLFYGIGHQPNSSLVEGQIELDDKGYVKVCIPFHLQLVSPAAEALVTIGILHVLLRATEPSFSLSGLHLI